MLFSKSGYLPIVESFQLCTKKDSRPIAYHVSLQMRRSRPVAIFLLKSQNLQRCKPFHLNRPSDVCSAHKIFWSHIWEIANFTNSRSCIMPKFHLARHVLTRHVRRRVRRDECVEPCCSTSSTQPKCTGSTRRTCRVVSRYDATSQVEFGLYCVYNIIFMYANLDIAQSNESIS